MQGRPRCDTSHLTFRARHDKHALGALFLILFWDLDLESVGSDPGASETATSDDMAISFLWG